jgi:hypothetical protein
LYLHSEEIEAGTAKPNDVGAVCGAAALTGPQTYLVTEAPLFSALPPGALAWATILYQPFATNTVLDGRAARDWMVVLHELEL